MGTFIERCSKDGTLVDTGGLLPSKDGAGVRLAKGKIIVTDAPLREQGGHRRLGDPGSEVEGRSSPHRDRVHGAAPEVWPDFEGESEVWPLDQGP